MKLECHRELVVHQAGRDEHALRIAEVEVAVADGVVAQRDVVALGDERLITLADGEWHEVVGLALERSRDRARYGCDHAVEIGFGKRDLAAVRVANAIGRLRDGGLADNFRRGPRQCGRCLRHIG